MKQNYKTKYFLKQVLDLAYLAKKANKNYILIKTKNLTVPFSDWQLKTMAKDCEALTLLKRGGYYNEETSKLEANHYAFDFELLQKLYKENPCKLRNLRKELANRKINVTAKKIKHLDEPDINSKYRCQYYVNSVKDAEDYIMNVRYKNLFSALKDDVMIANTFLDEPRKLKYQIKVTTRKDGALKKIGFRCTNTYVSAKKEDDKNENFHGKFKDDILAYYSLKEFDNSDVTSSIPRLTAVKNGKKWNEIEDYYIEILKYTMKLIDMKFINECKLDNQIDIDKINTIVINNQSIDYKLFNSFNSYCSKHSKKDNLFRENIKPMILPCYFDKSAKLASHHLNITSPKKKSYKNVQFWKNWCKTYNIDFRYFCECLYTALRLVCGVTYDSKIFLIESCAYARAARKLVENGFHSFLQIYDALYTETECNELSKYYEESVYEIIELFNKDMIEYKDYISQYKLIDIRLDNTFVINNTSIDYKLSYHTTAEGKLNKCIANKEKEKTERNQSILNDYKAGMKQKDIATKYNINVTRVSQLLKKYKNK